MRAGGDSRPLVVLDLSGTSVEEDADAAVRAAASLVVHLAERGGCALLLPGERRPLSIEPGLRGWPHAHARLALAEIGGAPAARRARGPPRRRSSGCRRAPLREPPRALVRAPARVRVLVVPGAVAGRTALFTVAGLHRVRDGRAPARGPGGGRRRAGRESRHDRPGGSRPRPGATARPTAFAGRRPRAAAAGRVPGLSMLGLLTWAGLVAPAPAGAAVLMALAAAACGGGADRGGQGRAPRARATRRWRARRVALARRDAARRRASPPGCSCPDRWDALVQGIVDGIGAIPGTFVPYRGGDEWVRRTLLLGGTALTSIAVLQAFWPRERGRAPGSAAAATVSLGHALRRSR